MMATFPFDTGWTWEGRHVYRGEPCEVGTGDLAWVVSREKGDVRRVEFGPFGLWQCTCPGWLYRRKCPHVEAASRFVEAATIADV